MTSSVWIPSAPRLTYIFLTVKRLALETNTICIATIHQPNYETFSLFDNLLLLAQGRVMYNGPAIDLPSYLDMIGHPTPQHESPSDHAINLVNTEFFSTSDGSESASEHLDRLHGHWTSLSAKSVSTSSASSGYTDVTAAEDDSDGGDGLARSLHRTGILVHRNLINYARNLLAFGIRSKSISAYFTILQS